MASEAKPSNAFRDASLAVEPLLPLREKVAEGRGAVIGDRLTVIGLTSFAG